MNQEPNKSKNEPNNEESKVLSDEELEGVVGGASMIYVAKSCSLVEKENLAELKDLAELK